MRIVIDATRDGNCRPSPQELCASSATALRPMLPNVTKCYDWKRDSCRVVTFAAELQPPRNVAHRFPCAPVATFAQPAARQRLVPYGLLWRRRDCWARRSVDVEHKEDLSSRVFEPNLKSFVQEARAEPLVKGNAWGFGVRRAAAISDCAREGSRGLCESRWRRE
jgi:hypothetical protein